MEILPIYTLPVVPSTEIQSPSLTVVLTDYHDPLIEIDLDHGCADDARDAELACYDGRMRRGAAFTGQNTFGGDHAMNVIRFGEWPYHDYILLLFLGHFLGKICIEISLTHSSTRRGVHAFAK